MSMDPVVLASARKQGSEMTTCPTPTLDTSRRVRRPHRGADAARRMLEVGLASAEGIGFILHAIIARPKFAR